MLINGGLRISFVQVLFHIAIEIANPHRGILVVLLYICCGGVVRGVCWVLVSGVLPLEFVWKG